MKYFSALKQVIEIRKKQFNLELNNIIKSFSSRLSTGGFRVMSGIYHPDKNNIEFLISSKNPEAFADPKSFLMEYFSIVKMGQMPQILSTYKRGNVVYVTFTLSLGD